MSNNNEEKLREEKEVIKLEKKLGFEFCDEMRTLTKETLSNKLHELAKYEQEVITSRKNDETLEEAKERAKELGAPYREALQENKNKKRFIGLLLEEMDK